MASKSQIRHILANFTQHQTAMEQDGVSRDLELTQRSSMSLTQENSCSVYEHLDIQSFVVGQNPSIISRNRYMEGREEHGNPLAEDVVSRAHIHDMEQQHSTRTDLTTHTYTEEDTGHITLEYHPEQDHALMEQADSQDASYTLQRVAPSSQPPLYEPQTPAPPVNPFKHNKGSVLKGFEMFGATQPSSIGRHVTSPTSSRPSPDVYNVPTSPPAHLLWSPLQRRNREEEKIPVQSSLRNTLDQSISDESPQANTSRTSGIQPIDAERLFPRINGISEPRRYNSMRASQERRNELESTPPASESDGSDSDIDLEPRKRRQRRERERDIRRQLSTVELHRHMSPAQPSSSNSALVEVPSTSTGRRQSIPSDDLGQPEVIDATDTQQVDFIQDSQGHFTPSEDVKGVSPRSSHPASSLFGKVRPSNRPSDIHSTQSSPSQSDPTHHSNARLNPGPEVDAVQPLDAPSSKGHSEDSLPIQIVSPNHKDPTTPLAMKPQMFSDPGVATVPETSPAQGQIRPMGHIGLSFGPDVDEGFSQRPPGFTQDDEFLNILEPQASPVAPRRARNFRKGSLEVATSPSHEGVSAPLKYSPSKGYPLLQDEPNCSSTVESDVELTRSRPTDVTMEGSQINRPPSGNQKLSASPDDQTKAISETEPRDPLLLSKLAPISSIAVEESTLHPPEGANTRSSLDFDTPSSSELSSVPSGVVTPAVTPCLTINSYTTKPPTRSSQRLAVPRRASDIDRTLAENSSKRNAKRKSNRMDEHSTALPPRASKRQSTGRGVKDDSVDPLSLPSPSLAKQPNTNKAAQRLFEGMTFAVSYVKQEQEKDNIIRTIVSRGGAILDDGFDGLFELDSKSGDKTDSDTQSLTLAPAASSIGFVALIADEHSRKSKYMQALALGLPCVSGRWIMSCVAKDIIIDWAPYLLCAGRSSFLGNAYLSRTLKSYSATTAELQTTFASRDKMLEGKSILLVMGKGNFKRKTFMFLTRALGPSRLGQVSDYTEARQRLLDAESCGIDWDLLYVDNAKTAESTIFSSVQPSKGRASKRKTGPTGAKGSAQPTPKRVRVLTDEDMIQSLILGQLVEED